MCESTYQQAAENVSKAGLKISGSKAKLIDQVLTHAHGKLSARDALEGGESPNSCEEDTNSSDSNDSWSNSLRYVKKSFKVLFVLVVVWSAVVSCLVCSTPEQALPVRV